MMTPARPGAAAASTLTLVLESMKYDDYDYECEGDDEECEGLTRRQVPVAGPLLGLVPTRSCSLLS